MVCMYVRFTTMWMCIGVENYAKYGEHKYVCVCVSVLKLEEIASDCEKIHSVDAISISFSDALRFSRENIIEWNALYAHMRFDAQNEWFLIEEFQIEGKFLLEINVFSFSTMLWKIHVSR